MTAAQVVDAAVRDSIWPHLRTLGFRRSKRTFERTFLRAVSHRVTLQSLSPRHGSGLVVHFGVGFDLLRKWTAVWRGVPEDEIGIVQLGDSTGHMVPPYTFRGTPVIDAGDLAGRVLAELREIAIPALERYSTLESAIQCWESDLPFGRANAREYAPLARLALGDREAARDSALRFAEKYSRMGADADVIAEQRRLARFLMTVDADDIR